MKQCDDEPQDVFAIIADSTDLLKRHRVDLDTARKVIVSSMLGRSTAAAAGRREGEARPGTGVNSLRRGMLRHQTLAAFG